MDAVSLLAGFAIGLLIGAIAAAFSVYTLFERQRRASDATLIEHLRLQINDLTRQANREANADLLRLAGAADEIVFQLYHDRHEVPGIARYDTALAAFERPFKVGLLPGMALPPRASRSANWRGSVTFLLKERTVRDASTGPGESVPVVRAGARFSETLRTRSLLQAWLR
jgi:hypothetical protein